MAKLTAPKIAQRVKVSILPSSDAKEEVELDYRFLIPGNFSRKEGQGPLKDRRLRVIGKKGDFKKVLEDVNPQLKFMVPNKLSDDPEAELEVNLNIKDMKDFHPDEIVKQVEPMQQLLKARQRLKQMKLMVLKDPNVRKAVEGVLKEGGGSIDDLMSKIETVEAGKEEDKKEAKK